METGSAFETPGNDSVLVTYDVYNTTEAGELTLPPRPHRAGFSETLLVTQHAGTVRLFSGGEQIEATANGQASCPDAPFPATAPDSIPAWVYADSNMVYGTSPHSSGTFPNRVLLVTFTPEATLEQKQAAVDLVEGEVVGGMGDRLSYLIRVEDDGSTDQLFEALHVLEGLPSVFSVLFDMQIQTTHPPRDSAGRGWRHDRPVAPDSQTRHPHASGGTRVAATPTALAPHHP